MLKLSKAVIVRLIPLGVGVIALTGCAALGNINEVSGDSNLLESESNEPYKSSFEELVSEGDEALRSGDIDTAQLKYALAIQKDQSDATVTYKLAVVHKHKKSIDIAEKLLRHALGIDSTHVPSKLMLGKVLTELQRYTEAEAIFDNVLVQNPQSINALNGLGVLNDMLGYHKEAQEYFLKALNLDKRSAKNANNLGYSYYLAGDLGEAERYFLDAVTIDSEYERAWANMALVYSRTGRLRAANAAFRKIVPEHIAANNIGYVGLLQGDNQLAQEQFSRAIDTAPSYYEVANRNLELILE